MDKLDQIRALLKSIETGDAGPVAVVDETKYVQHNPQTHEGSEGLAQLFARLAKTGPKVNMVRGFVDGEYVFAQMEYDFSSRKICFEVFRFENGKAVEHWDNIQERRGPNASGRSMVDGSTDLCDIEMTEENREFVRAFVGDVLLSGNPDALEIYIDPSNFAEHNPLLTDDLSDLRTALSTPKTAKPALEYQKLHRVLAQGNFVLTVCEGYQGAVHSAFYDLFRVARGKIVEHWDTTEAIAPTSAWKNTNGKF